MKTKHLVTCCCKYLFSACLVFTLNFSKSYGQAELLPISQELDNKLGWQRYFSELHKNHTALRSNFISDFSDTTDKDSLFLGFLPEIQPWQTKNWFFRKIFTEHLVEVKKSDYSFYLDFLPDFQIGKQGDHTLWLNTRGLEIGGKVGRQFAFTSHFFENQGTFADYYTDYARANRIVPGQGRARAYGTRGFDYGYSGGTISYTPSKYINFQLGYDKNFIGDGYRSLLLSDNAFNYPFFKVTATLGKLRYMAMYAQFIDFYDHFDLEQFDEDNPYPKKYGIFHYLSWNATNRLSLGLFENVMWEPRGFDFSYVSPLVFARPVEFANGSPDKVLMGLNASYKIADRYVAYGQFMLNEFRGKDFFSGEGHWATKHGEQLGIKGFDLFHLAGLSAQAEMNTVRPYSYASLEHFTNYGHYNQPLAHPYGANFREFLGIVNYRYKRFSLRLQLTGAMYGLDVDGLNYGKDIYKSYATRVSETGIFTGNGLKTHLHYTDARISYLLNPKNNLRIELGYIRRTEENEQMYNKQQVLNIGLRSSFRNLYSDF